MTTPKILQFAPGAGKLKVAAWGQVVTQLLGSLGHIITRHSETHKYTK